MLNRYFTSQATLLSSSYQRRLVSSQDEMAVSTFDALTLKSKI